MSEHRSVVRFNDKKVLNGSTGFSPGNIPKEPTINVIMQSDQYSNSQPVLISHSVQATEKYWPQIKKKNGNFH